VATLRAMAGMTSSNAAILPPGKPLVLEVTLKHGNESSIRRALVDSGADYNFISDLVVKELELPADESLVAPPIYQLGGPRLQTNRIHPITVAVPG